MSTIVDSSGNLTGSPHGPATPSRRQFLAAGGPALAFAAPPQPREPDPSGIVCTGKFFGDPVTMRFIARAEWERIPAGEKPRALKMVGGEWYAVFEVRGAAAPPAPAVHDCAWEIGGHRYLVQYAEPGAPPSHHPDTVAGPSNSGRGEFRLTPLPDSPR